MTHLPKISSREEKGNFGKVRFFFFGFFWRTCVSIGLSSILKFKYESPSTQTIWICLVVRHFLRKKISNLCLSWPSSSEITKRYRNNATQRQTRSVRPDLKLKKELKNVLPTCENVQQSYPTVHNKRLNSRPQKCFQRQTPNPTCAY